MPGMVNTVTGPIPVEALGRTLMHEHLFIAFGGAGPMVGCQVARELGVSRVLVPRAPGVVCALGGLVAEIRNDLVSTDRGQDEWAQRLSVPLIQSATK